MPSLNASFFFFVGMLFSASGTTVLLLSMAGLVIRKRRRAIAAAVSVISWLILITAGLLGVTYICEFLSAIFSRNVYERAVFFYRIFGLYAWAYWLYVFFQVLVPQLFWLRRCRTNLFVSLLIALAAVSPAFIEGFVAALLR